VNERELFVPDGPFSSFSLVSLNLAVCACQVQVQGSTGIRLVIYLSSSSQMLSIFCCAGLASIKYNPRYYYHCE